MLSENVERRRIYAHTGWCQDDDGRNAYAHVGGAIGAGGALPDVRTALEDLHDGYKLPDPPDDEARRGAVRASLNLLLTLGKLEIMAPLYGAIWRAVLGLVDFALHLSGPSGVFKTAVATLAQQHFGTGFTSRSLPGSWSSTPGSVELSAFQAKDAILVVDDYAPGGTSSDIARMERDAGRVFRAQGNRAAGGRLRPDGQARPSRQPRGLIVSTGEDVPPGVSVRARLLVIDVSGGDIDASALSRCQKDAADNLYATAMSAYLQWLAGKLDEARADFAAVRDRLVTEVQDASHARTPGTVAELGAALRLFLDFAVTVGAIKRPEADRQWDGCWQALLTVGRAQSEFGVAEDPVVRFLELLRSLFANKRAHLVDARSPERHPAKCDPADWGWQRAQGAERWSPRGQRIGWTDGEIVYLDPGAAYAAVRSLSLAQGAPLSVGPRTLWKRLNQRGMLASHDAGRNTYSKRIGSRQHDVIALPGSLVLGQEPLPPAAILHLPPSGDAEPKPQGDE